MTFDEAQKIQELRGIYYQIYELNRKADLIFASLQPKKKTKKFDPVAFQKELDRITNKPNTRRKRGLNT